MIILIKISAKFLAKHVSPPIFGLLSLSNFILHCSLLPHALCYHSKLFTVSSFQKCSFMFIRICIYCSFYLESSSSNLSQLIHTYSARPSQAVSSSWNTVLDLPILHTLLFHHCTLSKCVIFLVIMNSNDLFIYLSLFLEYGFQEEKMDLDGLVAFLGGTLFHPKHNMPRIDSSRTGICRRKLN